MAEEGAFLFGSVQSCIRDLSSVEILWVTLSGSYVFVGLCDALTDDGNASHQDFTATTGLLRFTKRPVKRWFLGLGIHSLLTFSMLRAYISGVQPYHWISSILESASRPEAIDSDRLSVMLASAMLTVHFLQKLHQSVFVNVHSSSTQGVLDFFSPFMYAGAVSITLLSQAPDLTVSTDSWFDWSLFSCRHLVGAALFIFATYQDHCVQPALANTRRNRAGHIVSMTHKVPKGGLYKMILCPSYFLSILNHVAIGVTLGCDHRAWAFCTGFVAVSHIVRSLRRRRWFQMKFKDDHSPRKAIIPYLL